MSTTYKKGATHFERGVWNSQPSEIMTLAQCVVSSPAPPMSGETFMPAVYEKYPCDVCRNSHAPNFPGRTVSDLGRLRFYTCPKLPFAIRVMASDRWMPAREKPKERSRLLGN